MDRYGTVPIGFIKSLVVGRSKQTLALKYWVSQNDVYTLLLNVFYYCTENTFIDIILIILEKKMGFLLYAPINVKNYCQYIYI